MSKKFSFKGKKVIVFDLDGTIVKLDVDWASLKAFLSDKYNKIYGESCSFETLSGCLSEMVQKNDEPEVNRFIDIIRERELENIGNNKYIEETVYFINNKELFGVSEQAEIAVLSLNTRSCIEESLVYKKMKDKISFIVGREDVRKWKPDPEGLLKIQAHFNVKKEEMVYIGDLDKDVLTGRNAGMDAYLIDKIINMVRMRRSD